MNSEVFGSWRFFRVPGAGPGSFNPVGIHGTLGAREWAAEIIPGILWFSDCAPAHSQINECGRGARDISFSHMPLTSLMVPTAEKKNGFV
ncbi:hypothetical protein AVEN_178062-1 [Araneus ventricosus]|uniref:Uncharacterized protein n=1 Tax=Araneus ventricosus TaxID=182803 RepID=A0A4Y2I599_ARAVE|nr:hypothetical protein AVEN_178062-1 [Araneus ventricosus]